MDCGRYAEGAYGCTLAKPESVDESVQLILVQVDAVRSVERRSPFRRSWYHKDFRPT